VEGRGGGSPKSEIRDPKEGRSPKSEAGMRGTGHEAFSGGDCFDAR